MGKADGRLQVARPLSIPRSPPPATQKLPSLQYLVFSAVWSFMIPPPDSNLPVRVCSDEPILYEEQQPVRGTTPSAHTCRTVLHSFTALWCLHFKFHSILNHCSYSKTWVWEVTGDAVRRSAAT